MPNQSGKTPSFVGVDGCPSGWASVKFSDAPQKGDATNTAAFETQVFETAEALMQYLRASACIALIDMPIGLLEEGKRACEKAARAALGPRRSSIFPAPRRPMLDFVSYEEANQWGKMQGANAGGGLSKQAWNILPKIKDLDAVITPTDQQWLGEGHPELAFTRIIGNPCRYPKRSLEGANEREDALRKNGIDPLKVIASFRKIIATKTLLADDDILDACVLALSASARFDGTAIHLTDGTVDRCGLALEIWG
ncbi:MAG: DUF429 domain-containing protein [Pseudomonadota bacterium]